MLLAVFQPSLACLLSIRGESENCSIEVYLRYECVLVKYSDIRLLYRVYGQGTSQRVGFLFLISFILICLYEKQLLLFPMYVVISGFTRHIAMHVQVNW